MSDRRNVRRKKPDVPVPVRVPTSSVEEYSFAPPEPPRQPCTHERWATEVSPATVKHLEHYYQLANAAWAWDRDRERTFVAPEHVFCVECGKKRSEVTA